MYYVKYYGKEEVPSAVGNSVVDYALHQILTTKAMRKKQGWQAPRVELSIGVSGVKITDRFAPSLRLCFVRGSFSPIMA